MRLNNRFTKLKVQVRLLIFVCLFFFQVQLVVAQQDVEISGQTWTAENLNMRVFANGDTIPIANSMEEWRSACENKQAICAYYDFNPQNGERHGLLYNVYALKDDRGLASKGYRLPTSQDWQTLLTPFKPLSSQNRSFKSSKELKSETGWDKRNGNNKTGFSAYPSGQIRDENSQFNGLGNKCVFFGGFNTTNDRIADIIMLESDYNGVNIFLANVNQGCSVRLIKQD